MLSSLGCLLHQFMSVAFLEGTATTILCCMDHREPSLSDDEGTKGSEQAIGMETVITSVNLFLEACRVQYRDGASHSGEEIFGAGLYQLVLDQTGRSSEGASVTRFWRFRRPFGILPRDSWRMQWGSVSFSTPMLVLIGPELIEDIGCFTLAAFLLPLHRGATCQAGRLALRTWPRIIAPDLASAARVTGLLNYRRFRHLTFGVVRRGGGAERSRGEAGAKAGVVIVDEASRTLTRSG